MQKESKETQTELKRFHKPVWEALNLRTYILQAHPHIYREFKFKISNNQLGYERVVSYGNTNNNFREDGKCTKPKNIGYESTNQV